MGSPDYERSTRATTLAALPEPIRSAVRERAACAQLTLADDARAYLTHSRRLRKPGLFSRLTRVADPDIEHLTALVIGRRDVLVATDGAQRGTAVLAARLEDAEVSPVSELLVAAGAARDDEGVTVTGFAVSVEGVTSRGSYFVGLGPPAADAARETLEAAVRRAKA